MEAIPGWDQSRLEDSESDRRSDKSDPLSDRCRLEGRESGRASLQNARRYVKRNARVTQLRTGGANFASFTSRAAIVANASCPVVFDTTRVDITTPSAFTDASIVTTP